MRRRHLLTSLLLGLAVGCAHPGHDALEARAEHGGHAELGGDSAGSDPEAHVARHAAIDRLVAIEDIKQLKARFMRCVDTKDLPCLRDEVFAPGAEIHFKGTDYDISAAGWTAIEKFYQGAFTPTKFGMHHAHTPEITIEGETARGTWYLHDIFVNLDENWTLQGSALYDDSYATIDGRWRIMFSTYQRLWEETTPRDPKTKLGSIPVRE
jgi:hypothetical protein